MNKMLVCVAALSMLAMTPARAQDIESVERAIIIDQRNQALDAVAHWRAAAAVAGHTAEEVSEQVEQLVRNFNFVSAQSELQVDEIARLKTALALRDGQVDGLQARIDELQARKPRARAHKPCQCQAKGFVPTIRRMLHLKTTASPRAAAPVPHRR